MAKAAECQKRTVSMHDKKKMEIYSVPIYDCVCETAARFVILHIIIIIIIRMFITFIYGIFGMLYC